MDTDRVDAAGQHSPGPRLPAGAVCEMAPATEPRQRDREQDESDQLHVQHGAQSTHAVRGEAREKIRAAPRQRGQDAQENSHDGLGGLTRGLARPGGQTFFDLQAEDGHDFLQIFPDFAFCAGIAQQVRGVIRGQEFSAAEIEPLPAKM